MDYTIHIIGTGGTGSFVMRNISFYLSNNEKADKFNEMLHCYDGDIVERKNLTRQVLFTADDIGEKKASVLAGVLNDCVFADGNMAWVAHPEYVLPKTSFMTAVKEKVRSYREMTPIVISCVDNNACRLLVEKTLDSLKNFFLIDCGNDDKTGGEVFFTSKVDGKRLSMFKSEVFPDLKKKAKAINEMSCEELNNSLPQHMFTNMQAAQIASCAFADFVENNKFPQGATYFDTALYRMEFVDYSIKETKKSSRRNTTKKKGA